MREELSLMAFQRQVAIHEGFFVVIAWSTRGADK